MNELKKQHRDMMEGATDSGMEEVAVPEAK